MVREPDSIGGDVSRRILYGAFDPSQRPAKPAQRKVLLFLFFAQDIHRRRIYPPLQLMSGSATSLAAFQVSTDGRFWVSPEDILDADQDIDGHTMSQYAASHLRSF
jgi:hypothetical protein